MASVESISPPVGCKEIPGFPGYCVSTDGEVWSYKPTYGRNRLACDQLRDGWCRLKGRLDRQGYRWVSLFRPDGKRRQRGVHILVLEAFVGPRPPGTEACHYPDPTRTNNNLNNLRWDTHRENQRDRCRYRASATEKRCSKCGQIKPLDAYHRNREIIVDGRRSDCKSCFNKAKRELYKLGLCK